jgi:hypothetical protein
LSIDLIVAHSKGHAFGNLFLAALEEVTGSSLAANRTFIRHNADRIAQVLFRGSKSQK